MREVNSLTIESKTDFGDPSHSAHILRDSLFTWLPTTIDKTKKCLSVVNVAPNSDEFVNSEPIPLDEQGRAHISEGSACSYVYRTVSDNDVKIILVLKRVFEKPFTEVREQLQNIDIGCPHVHHLKLRGMDEG